MLILPCNILADPGQVSEYEVKAAFLYNFAKFVEWPESNLKNLDSLEICVFGSNPFGNHLESIVSGKTAQEKAIKISYTSNIGKIQNCQILFVADNDKNQTEKILEATSELPILTVSDLSDFASKDGIIGFYTEDNRIRFEVNRQKANNSGLSFSSRLLKIARLVDSEE